jgi:hypothetical protein
VIGGRLKKKPTPLLVANAYASCDVRWKHMATFLRKATQSGAYVETLIPYVQMQRLRVLLRAGCCSNFKVLVVKYEIEGRHGGRNTSIWWKDLRGVSEGVGASDEGWFQEGVVCRVSNGENISF